MSRWNNGRRDSVLTRHETPTRMKHANAASGYLFVRQSLFFFLFLGEQTRWFACVQDFPKRGIRRKGRECAMEELGNGKDGRGPEVEE